MIYDNAYCMKVARHLIDRFGNDPELLEREISGELSRLYRMGQSSIEYPVRKALSKAYGGNVGEGPK